MPEITRFYGMVIKMYFQQAEYNPPHFPVVYGETAGIYRICSRVSGSMSADTALS
jgi:hypothetical protein